MAYTLGGLTFRTKKAIKEHVRAIRDSYADREFWLMRTDGTETDFSFLKCLSPPTKMQCFNRACRTAIAPSVIEFKQRFFANKKSFVCPLTGETVTQKSSHVDHTPPKTFSAIVRSFIQQQKIDVNVIGLYPHGDGDTTERFADAGLVRSFIAFHDRHARLRVVSAAGNLALGDGIRSRLLSWYPLTLHFPVNAHVAVSEGQWEREKNGSILATFANQSELAWCLVASGCDRPEVLEAAL